jgi:hypothetical protein
VFIFAIGRKVTVPDVEPSPFSVFVSHATRNEEEVAFVLVWLLDKAKPHNHATRRVRIRARTREKARAH